MTLDPSVLDADNLWEVIGANAGKTFYTKKGLPFTYRIKGGELFTDRRERSVTLSTFQKAYEKLIADQTGENPPCRINGPHALNLYGGAYVWAVFMGVGFIRQP